MAWAPPMNGTRASLQSGRRRSASAESCAAGTSTASLLPDHWRLLLFWLVLLAVPFAAPNEYLVSLANLFLINVILIASLNLLMGYGGQISLGHAGFFGLGAYVSGILSAKARAFRLDRLARGHAHTGLAALVIGVPVLRLRGLYLSMATLGWNAILVVLFNRLVELTGGPNGLLGVAPFSIGGFRLDTDLREFPLVWLVSLAGNGRHSPPAALAVRPRAARGRDQRTRSRSAWHRQRAHQAPGLCAERRNGGNCRQSLCPHQSIRLPGNVQHLEFHPAAS